MGLAGVVRECVEVEELRIEDVVVEDVVVEDEREEDVVVEFSETNTSSERVDELWRSRHLYVLQ